MQEENEQNGGARQAIPEKFATVEALAQAYRELEAEFTRRSRRLKELERAALEQRPQEPPKEQGEPCVPLMTHSGVGVSAPAPRARSLREAGALALGYLKSKK